MFDPDRLATVKTIVEIIATAFGVVVTIVGGLVAYLKTRKANPDNVVEQSAMTAPEKEIVLNALRLWRYGGVGLAIVLFIVSAVLLVFALLPGPDQAAMSRYLARHDPTLFNRAGNHAVYDFARVFPDQQALQSETDLSETLRNTMQTFDLVALHGMSVIKNYENEVNVGLKRGVVFRIVLWDPRKSNQANFDVMAAVGGHDPDHQRQRVRESVKSILDLQQRVERDRSTYTGRIEVRYLPKPVVYSMWIRDGNDASRAMAHLSVPQYRGETQRPCFRMSDKACKRSVEGLRSEFETIWSQAEPATP